jgi:hypothetical protein
VRGEPIVLRAEGAYPPNLVHGSPALEPFLGAEGAWDGEGPFLSGYELTPCPEGYLGDHGTHKVANLPALDRFTVWADYHATSESCTATALY